MCFNMNFAVWKSQTILNLLDIKGVECKLLIIYDGIKSSKNHTMPRKSLNTFYGGIMRELESIIH